MVNPLDDDLIARIRSRAENPDTRTDAPPAARGRSVRVGPVAAVGISLDALLRGDTNPAPAAPEALSPPPDGGAIGAAERALGFALPGPLRQLYLNIGDGGFGPSAGLMALGQLVRIYRTMISEPPGPRGQKWPPELLPFAHTDPGYVCIHVLTGAIVFWDEEELAEGSSDKVWKRSFKPEAADLGTWFETWLGTPTPEEQAKSLMQKGMHDAIRQSLAYWRSKTPEERAAFGLPEKGWEEKLFGHLGLDLSRL